LSNNIIQKDWHLAAIGAVLSPIPGAKGAPYRPPHASQQPRDQL
jgi:hypothetical protein